MITNVFTNKELKKKNEENKLFLYDNFFFYRNHFKTITKLIY